MCGIVRYSLKNIRTRKPNRMLSKIDLLVLTSLDQLLLILKTLLTFLQKSYLNEEANRTEPSPSISCSLIRLSR